MQGLTGASASGGGPLVQRLSLWQRKRDQKVRMQREEQERKKNEEGECSFRPKLTKKGRDSRRKTQGTSVVSRLYEWQRRRERNLEDQAREARRSQDQGCTFKPRLEDTTQSQGTQSRLDPDIRRALHRPEFQGSLDLQTAKGSSTKRAKKARRRIERNLKELQQDGIEKFLERQEHGRA